MKRLEHRRGKVIFDSYVSDHRRVDKRIHVSCKGAFYDMIYAKSVPKLVHVVSRIIYIFSFFISSAML